MQWITIIGVAASLCTGTSMLPQLIKLIKEKKADDISFLMLVVLLIGLGLWVVYGVAKQDYIIVASNGLSFSISLLILILGLIYSRKS